MKHWLLWLPPGIALALAGLLWAADANVALFRLVNGMSTVTGKAPWPFVTILGDTAVAIALLTPLALRRPSLAWAIALGAVAATLMVHGCKPFFEVPRPPAVLDAASFTVIGPAYRSNAFPSGHTTTAFLAAGLLCLHHRSRTVWLAALPIATLAGLSRAVVGVHWPMDILVGAAGGWSCAVLGTRLAARWPWGRRAPVHAVLVTIGLGCAIALLAGLKTGYPTAIPLQRGIASLVILDAIVMLLGAMGRSVEAGRPASGNG